MATASKTATDDKAADAAARSDEPEQEQVIPEVPDASVDRSSQGTLVGLVNVRDADVTYPDYYIDPKARKDDQGVIPDDDAPKGTLVDVFQVSASGGGVLLLVNDQSLLLDGTQAITLKRALDAAVMSGVH